MRYWQSFKKFVRNLFQKTTHQLPEENNMADENKEGVQEVVTEAAIDQAAAVGALIAKVEALEAANAALAETVGNHESALRNNNEELSRLYTRIAELESDDSDDADDAATSADEAAAAAALALEAAAAAEAAALESGEKGEGKSDDENNAGDVEAAARAEAEEKERLAREAGEKPADEGRAPRRRQFVKI